MNGWTHPATIAAELDKMTVDQQRVRLRAILDEPWEYRHRDSGMFASGLQRNALLCTLLHDRGTRIWGTT